MRSSQWGRALLTCTLLVTVPACTSADPPSDAIAGRKDVTIGYLAPLTGQNASVGSSAQFGGELAAEIVNSAMPSLHLPLAGSAGLPRLGGARLKIVAMDTKSDPETAVSAVDRLADDENVTALSGAYESAVTHAASDRAEDLRVPFVNGDSSALSLTERGLDWFFRTGPTDRTFAETFFSLLKEEQNKGTATRRVAVVHTTDRFGIDGVAMISRLTSQTGGKIVADIPFPTTVEDLAAEVEQLRSAKPDVVFALAYTDQAVSLTKSMQGAGYCPPALLTFGAGFVSPAYLRKSKEAAEGILSRTAWSYDLAQRNPTAKAVADLYQQRYKIPMDDVAARAFTAVMTLAQAIDQAGSTDRSRVRAALVTLNVPGRETIMPWDGISFDENHQNTGARGTVEQLLDGRYRVVYPDDVAAQPVTWPMSAASTSQGGNSCGKGR